MKDYLPALGVIFWALLVKAPIPSAWKPFAALLGGLLGGVLVAVAEGHSWSQAPLTALQGLGSGALAVGIHETVKNLSSKSED